MGQVTSGAPGTLPRYRDLAAELTRRIVEGDYAAGERLPSEQALAAAYGVSRSTVRAALDRLAHRGQLTSRPNVGWVVQSGHRTQGLDRFRSFAQWAEDRGASPGGCIVGWARGVPTPVEQRQLRLRGDEQVLRFTRVRTLDGRRVMVERSSWAPWVQHVIEGLPDGIVSTTRALAESGIHVAHGAHRIEAVAASSEDARLLGVRRSSPLLQVIRATYAQDGRAVELGEDRYLSEAVAFEVQASGTIARV